MRVFNVLRFGPVVLLFGLAAGVRADDPPAASADRPSRPRTAASQEEIAEWIAALGAREFDARDRAMHALIEIGVPAIEPVQAITNRRDQEIATRAVMVLKGIGEAGDIDTLEVALAALQRISTSGNGPAARRASEAQVRLESARQDRTIEFFRARGAEVSRQFTDVWAQALFGPEIFAVEIGPKWSGTEKDLERLKWLHDVEQVSLVGEKVRDDWFAHLQALPRLQSVKVKHAPITTKALEELGKLERLRAVRLMFVPLGDEMVPYLTKYESVLRLVVISNKLTDLGELRLKQRFEDAVECPRGAMLGVRAGLEEPWAIREVVTGSAADKAGLKVDDRIVKFNGEAVSTFPELRSLISKCSPGETANLEVERGGETFPMKITFGEWD